MKAVTDPSPDLVIFVCTANRIRSPFAEVMARTRNLRPRWLPQVPIVSRGTEAEPGKAAVDAAITTARRYGADLTDHQAALFDPEEAENAWIIGMAPEHLPGGTLGWRQSLLGEFCGLDAISDPAGMPEDAFVSAYEIIIRGLRAWALLPDPDQTS